jgi:heptosyltransferase-1
VRVLIVLPGALGDVIRALPLLGRLRRAWPGAHIGWVVEPLSSPVLRDHPWLDAVHVFARARGLAGVIPLVRELRSARYELALDLGRGAKSGWIARLSGARERLGFSRADGREGGWLLATRRLPPQDTERSKLEQFLAFADLLGVPEAPVGFGLEPSAEELAEANTLTAGLSGPLVAACVGSSCPSRRWFPQQTAEVLQRLAARRGASAVLLGTTADAGFAAAVHRLAPGPLRDLVGRTSLRQLLAVLHRAAVVFGPDSGALHLAAAVGTPVVSLWGATSPQRSAPFGSEAYVVTGGAPCAPCFLRDCPIGRLCMHEIGVETVVARAEAALAA